MKRPRNTTFWGNFRFFVPLVVLTVSLVEGSCKGFGTIQASSHPTWVWCLWAFMGFFYIELLEAANRQKVARLEDDRDYWMTRTSEEQKHTVTVLGKLAALEALNKKEEG